MSKAVRITQGICLNHTRTTRKNTEILQSLRRHEGRKKYLKPEGFSLDLYMDLQMYFKYISLATSRRFETSRANRHDITAFENPTCKRSLQGKQGVGQDF